jgi:anaerobic dimethyl sulfoxide reductase subunit B (iron-sulfur subunit)
VPAGPASWIRINTIEKGKYPDLFVAFLPVTCYHCLQPACIPACPTDAITKRDEDGIVTVDTEMCLGAGCQLCLEACPYDAPQFGSEEDAKMQKCDLCVDRWAEGKKPICVDGCPMWALDAGPVDELRAKYGDVRCAEGFVYSEDLAPSITFKPKQGAKGLVTQKILISPPAL